MLDHSRFVEPDMTRYTIPIGVLLLSVACSSEQGTAAKDLAAADSAIAAVSAEARNVAPEQITLLAQAVEAGRRAFEAGQYQVASAGLHGVPNQVKVLLDSVPAWRAALSAEMDTLSVAFPRNIGAIKAELDKIRRTGRRPQGLDRQRLDEVQKTYAAAGPAWSDIQTAFQAVQVAEALGRAQQLKVRVSSAMLALGLVADERAWSNVTLPPR